MKKIFRYIAVAAVAFVFTSCSEDAVDGLTGKYPAPEFYTLDSTVASSVTKNGSLRIFDVTITNAAGDLLDLKLANSDYYLSNGTYTPGSAEAPRRGNFLTGEGGSTFAAAGKAPVAFERGSINVSSVGDDYTIKGVIWLAGGEVIKFESKTQLHYEADPEALHLTQVLTVTNNVPNGTKSVTINLGTDGLSLAPNAWGGNDIVGSGNYLAVDFYTEDGTLAAGTYTPAAAGTETAMNYTAGYDPGDIWGIGMVFTNWGTCWWTVDNGASSAVHIESGAIEVKKSGNVYTISYHEGDLFFDFTGEIPGLTEAGGGEDPQPVDYIEISNFLSATLNNGTTLSLQLATDGITMTPNMWGGADLAGDGNYLKIDLYTTTGELEEGEYTAVDNTALAPFTFAKGYDPGDIWGIGMEFKNWGTAWMTRDGGNETGVNIEDGAIKVEKSGADYVITLTSSTVNVRYTGPINL